MALIVDFMTTPQRKALREKVQEISEGLAKQLGLTVTETDILYTKIVQGIELMEYPTTEVAE